MIERLMGWGLAAGGLGWKEQPALKEKQGSTCGLGLAENSTGPSKTIKMFQDRCIPMLNLRVREKAGEASWSGG